MPYIRQVILFVLVLCVVSGALGLHRLVNLPPISVHQWRQGDCAAQVASYYHDGMNFFAPSVYNFISSTKYPTPPDRQTVGEFPILYYLAAVVDKIIGGEYVFVPRSLDFFVFSLGLWALFRLFWHVSGNVLVSLSAVMSLLSSPIVAFYGVNFLPNVPVLGMTFISWLWLYHYTKTNNSRWLWAFQAISVLIGLIRPTFLVTWLSVGAIWCFDALRKKEHTLLFKKENRWQAALSFFPLFIALIAWRFFSTQYNQLHQSEGFFLANVMPIWATDAGQRSFMCKIIVGFWLPHYWWNVAGCLMILLALGSLFWVRLQNRLFFTLFLLIFLGETAYVLLFFKQFSVHDYYVIDLFVLPAIIFLNLLFVLKNKTNALQKTWVQAIFIVFLISNIVHTHKILWKVRLNPKDDLMHNLPQAVNPLKTRTFLRSVGILPTDTILSLTDYSPNASLYMFNLHGYTNWNFGSVYPTKDLLRQRAHTHYIKYLIVNSYYDEMLDSVRRDLPPIFARMDTTLRIYRFSDWKN